MNCIVERELAWLSGINVSYSLRYELLHTIVTLEQRILCAINTKSQLRVSATEYNSHNERS